MYPDGQQVRKRGRQDEEEGEDSNSARMPHQQSPRFNSAQAGILSNPAYMEYYRQLARQNDLNSEAVAARNRAQLFNNSYLGNLSGVSPQYTGNLPSAGLQNWASLASGTGNVAGAGTSTTTSQDALATANRNYLLSQLHMAPQSNDTLYHNYGNMFATTAPGSPPSSSPATAQFLASRHLPIINMERGIAEMGQRSNPHMAFDSQRPSQFASLAAPFPAESDSLAQLLAARQQQPNMNIGQRSSHHLAIASDSDEAALLRRNAHTADNTKLLYMRSDDESISPYQRYARMQIELFEADALDVQSGAQGRNKPVVLGQVGIRCIHCADLSPKARARAAVYYPSRLEVLYQAAQNIVNVHLPKLCESIPDETRQKLIKLDNKRSSVGGGKNYWSDCAQIQGVFDTPDGLRFKENSGTS